MFDRKKYIKKRSFMVLDTMVAFLIFVFVISWSFHYCCSSLIVTRKRIVDNQCERVINSSAKNFQYHSVISRRSNQEMKEYVEDAVIFSGEKVIPVKVNFHIVKSLNEDIFNDFYFKEDVKGFWVFFELDAKVLKDNKVIFKKNNIILACHKDLFK